MLNEKNKRYCVQMVDMEKQMESDGTEYFKEIQGKKYKEMWNLDTTIAA